MVLLEARLFIRRAVIYVYAIVVNNYFNAGCKLIIDVFIGMSDN